MKYRILAKKLKAAGYKLVRTGDHDIYQKENARSVQVPHHRDVNEETAKAILRAAGIK